MNKLTLALALGTGLSLGMAVTPPAVAGPIQTLQTPELSAEQFNSLYRPMDGAPALSSNFQLVGSPATGSVRSQVFEGFGEAAGTYAYGYQVSVNPVLNEAGEPVHVDSLSYRFNDTPMGTDLLKTGQTNYGYTVTNGAIGGLAPPAPASGATIQKPTNFSWQPNDKTGVIRVQYVDPETQTGPLGAGADSATFVVISDQLFTKQFVSLQSDSPTTGEPTSVYSATGGTISPVPVPEPSTVLAWAGMAGAVALVRRVRKNRPSA